jgi:DNA-binding transcriptional regulator YhcF (GntR family)
MDAYIGNNGWQNVGIMAQYSFKNIRSQSKRDVFIGIVEESFGYGNAQTLHKTQEYWANMFDITRKTFNKIVRELEADGHIKINHKKGYMVGGGSVAYSYSPVFPKHAKIWIKSKNNEPEITKESEEESTW